MRLPKRDHYELARDAALRRLREGWDADRLSALQARLLDEGRTVALPVLCWRLEVCLEPYAMRVLPDGREAGITWQILALNYLGAGQPAPPRGLRSLADFAEGRGYEKAFEGRVIGRLSRTAGRDRESLARAAGRLGAVPTGHDPMRCMFRFFPLLEFQVSRYEGDEDFPASCSVLFSDNLLSLFSMEDGIVAAERLVAALEGKTPVAGK